MIGRQGFSASPVSENRTEPLIQDDLGKTSMPDAMFRRVGAQLQKGKNRGIRSVAMIQIDRLSRVPTLV